MKYRVWHGLAILLIAVHVHAVPVSIVSHQWLSKIVDSRNNVTIRPGSVYEINTYFEQIFDGLQPKFKYIFRDTGLGAADPIYPVFQQGYQQSWLQLMPAMWSEKQRHIDHYSRVETPEGCIVHSAYWVRHIDEFPEQWQQEREQGYTLVDIGFDYYESKTPEVLCGKHRPHPIVAEQDNPIEQLKVFAAEFNGYDSLPESLLAKLETKTALLKLINEEFSDEKWPRYDTVYNLQDNSMWYYTDNIENFYGQNKPIVQPYLKNVDKPSDFFVEPDAYLKDKITLLSLITPKDFQHLINHLKGNPESSYVPQTEPGGDHFSVNQIDKRHIFTRGLDLWKIKNINRTISNPNNFHLVSMIIRPYQQSDAHHSSEKIIPQMRFVFQLHDPEQNKLTEQLFLHIIFDGVDSKLRGNALKAQHKRFLQDYDHAAGHSARLVDFIQRYKQSGVRDINYSSSLTGIWMFGSLSRAHNPIGTLQAQRIKRQGLDMGYYSSIWDLELFRDTIKNSNDPQRREGLEDYLSKVTPTEYRDPKRHDVNNITFKDMTCAACHQMSGRDGVHVAINDQLDPRVKTDIRVTEFTVKELARQLEFGQSFW